MYGGSEQDQQVLDALELDPRSNRILRVLARATPETGSPRLASWPAPAATTLLLLAAGTMLAAAARLGSSVLPLVLLGLFPFVLAPVIRSVGDDRRHDDRGMRVAC